MKITSESVSFCIPVVATDYDSAVDDIKSALRLEPDILEIRRDFFEDPENEEAFLKFLKNVREDGTEIIYTYRDISEGGAREASPAEKLKAVSEALKQEAVDYVDIETAAEPDYAKELTELVHSYDKAVIRSAHNFNETPEELMINDTLGQALNLGDIVKAAYKCNSLEDLKKLIIAGDHFRKENPEVPLILIGMDQSGVLSRIVPELLGSNLTFVTDRQASAPGQKSLSEVLTLRKELEL